MINADKESVLHRMAQGRAAVQAQVPLTASRAIRLATTKAAQHSIGLVTQVAELSEVACDLERLQAALAPGMLLIALRRSGGAIGLIACDQEVCAASIEMQTLGTVSARAPGVRQITRADAALILPCFQSILSELTASTSHTSLDGWVDDVETAERLENARAAGFLLKDQPFRLIRLTLTLGESGRSGDILLALPSADDVVDHSPVAPAPDIDWATAFRNAVMSAPARLDAVLHRFDLPASVATNLDVGQMVPLRGCTVGAVRLIDPDGRLVARARLGQIAGQIALRIEDNAAQSIEDLPSPAHGHRQTEELMLIGEAGEDAPTTATATG